MVQEIVQEVNNLEIAAALVKLMLVLLNKFST